MKQWCRTCILLFMVLLLCSGCSNSGSAPPPVDQTAVQRPPLRTAPVLQQETYRQIAGIGTAQARLEVEVAPEISGRVVGVHCEVGDEVRAGDVLVELDGESRRIAVEKKRAMVKKAFARLEKSDRDKIKADSLFSGGVLSGTEHEDATLDFTVSDADLQLARAELRAAEKEYRDTRITAPYDGVVALRSVEVGHFVTPGKRLLTLVDLTGITIRITVSELDVPLLSPDCPVRVTIDSLPAQSFDGHVKTIGLKAEDTSRSFPVEISVANPERRILPGMVARVTIRAARPHQILTVPHAAVSSVHGETVVHMVSDNGTSLRTVRLGSLLGDRVVVESGVAAGDRVALPATLPGS